MENNTELHNYITTAYERWVDYAARYIRRSRLPINPKDLVNDILCVLLERNAEKMTQLLSQQTEEHKDLDFFIMRVIKINIYSPRSNYRYQRKQHCTINLQNPSQLADNTADSTKDQDDEYRALVCKELDGIRVTPLARSIFIWKFLDGKTIVSWPGPESLRVRYRAYNRTMKKITCEIGKKREAYSITE